MHADVVGPCGLGLDRVGVDVLEEFKAAVAVWRLEHGDLAWLPSRPTAVSVHSPLTVSRPRTVKPRSVPSLRRDIAEPRVLLDASAVNRRDLQCGGTADDNNVWGEGWLDAFALVEAGPRARG
jgi:hypothetical protein